VRELELLDNAHSHRVAELLITVARSFDRIIPAVLESFSEKQTKLRSRWMLVCDIEQAATALGSKRFESTEPVSGHM
jgi:hypothetical protein